MKYRLISEYEQYSLLSIWTLTSDIEKSLEKYIYYTGRDLVELHLNMSMAIGWKYFFIC